VFIAIRRNHPILILHSIVGTAFLINFSVLDIIVSLSAFFDDESWLRNFIRESVRDGIQNQTASLTEDQYLVLVPILLAILGIFSLLFSLWWLSIFLDCFKQLKLRASPDELEWIKWLSFLRIR
ncbi:hypothetical protein PFISCL1PPCAC_17126, partial [Pristionchus fissidentatus]